MAHHISEYTCLCGAQVKVEWEASSGFGQIPWGPKHCAKDKDQPIPGRVMGFYELHGEQWVSIQAY